MLDLLTVLSDNPALRFYQLVLIVLGVVAVYLVCFTTRDILLRSRSFFLQAFSILLVALVPVLGFFLYLLIRPSRTLLQRETDDAVRMLVAQMAPVEAFEMEEASDPEGEGEQPRPDEPPASPPFDAPGS